VRVAIKVFEVIGRVVVTMAASLIRGAVLIAALDILLNKLGPVSAALRATWLTVSGQPLPTSPALSSAAFNNAGKAVAAGFINFGINAVNKMIDAYNKLADVLPGVTRATHIAQFQFKNLSGAAASTGKAVDHLGGSNAALRQASGCIC
jgi:hypothetical protein